MREGVSRSTLLSFVVVQAGSGRQKSIKILLESGTAKDFRECNLGWTAPLKHSKSRLNYVPWELKLNYDTCRGRIELTQLSYDYHFAIFQFF